MFEVKVVYKRGIMRWRTFFPKGGT